MQKKIDKTKQVKRIHNSQVPNQVYERGTFNMIQTHRDPRLNLSHEKEKAFKTIEYASPKGIMFDGDFRDTKRILETDKTQVLDDQPRVREENQSQSDAFTKAQYYLTSEQRNYELNQTSPVVKAVGQFELDKYSGISGRTKERLRMADNRLQERIAFNDSITYGGSISNYGHARQHSSPAIRGNIFTRKTSVVSGNSKVSGSSQTRTRLKASSPALSSSSAKEREALAQFQLICSKVMSDHFKDEKYAQLVSVPSLFKKICQKPILKHQIISDIVKQEYQAQIEAYKR